MEEEIKDLLLDDNLEPVAVPSPAKPDLPADDDADDGVQSDEGDPPAAGGLQSDPDAADEEAELAAAETEEDRDAIRARRREERKQRKQRAHEREDNLRRELAARDAVINQLSDRLNHIDRRNNGFDLAQLDGQMQQLNAAYVAERERVVKGTTEGDGDAVASATERMMQIRERFNQLAAARQAYAQSRSAPPPLDPRIRQYGSEWSSKNRWYNPAGNDIQSRITRVIDDSLVQEGWDPTTKEYWDELDRRVKKQVFNGQNGQQRDTRHQNGPNGQDAPPPARRRSGPPVGAPGAPGKSSAAGYTLSADRVRALQDAGLWEDPVKRKAAIENYKKFDQEHGA